MNDKVNDRSARVNALWDLACAAAEEYINEMVRTETHSRSDAETNADDIDDVAMDMASMIWALYDALPNIGGKYRPFVDFAEGVLERVTEAMEDREAATCLDAAAVYYLYKNYAIDIQEERDNRKARLEVKIAAINYEEGLK